MAMAPGSDPRGGAKVGGPGVVAPGWWPQGGGPGVVAPGWWPWGGGPRVVGNIKFQ